MFGITIARYMSLQKFQHEKENTKTTNSLSLKNDAPLFFQKTQPSKKPEIARVSLC